MEEQDAEPEDQLVSPPALNRVLNLYQNGQGKEREDFPQVPLRAGGLLNNQIDFTVTDPV